MLEVYEPEAKIIRMIFDRYLAGQNIEEIAAEVTKSGIPTRDGKHRWQHTTVSYILRNQRYIGYIVSFDDFFLAQGEKSKRSNIDEDTNKRRATRHNSQSVLSGLLVCAECSHNYRSITRSFGEIVWRCASRVEHGKKFCKHSPSISEEKIKELICEKLGMSTFDGIQIKD